MVGIRKSSRSKRSSLSNKKRSKRVIRTPTRLTYIDRDVNNIMVEVLNINGENETLKEILLEVDTEYNSLILTEKNTEDNINKIVFNAYNKAYRSSNSNLGKLIRKRSKYNVKYAEQLKSYSDAEIGRYARSKINKKLKTDRKYKWDVHNDTTKKIYNKVFMVGKKDKEKDAHPETKGTIDMWTIRHFMGGLVIGLIVPNYSKEFFVGGVGFEAGEEWLARKTPKNSGMKETVGNKATDLVANQLGYELGSAIRNGIDVRAGRNVET